MKRILFSLFLAAAGLSANAMNARDAREYAYFLTDKMAYELNLTPLQYERVYEVNLDFFLAVNSPYDVDRYQDYRDDDLRYILSERQYWDYSNANYFYRPLTWGRGAWEFRIYNRYSYRNNYYFGRPSCYDSYQGSNWSLRLSNARSPYWGVSFDFRYGGMRDSYARYYNNPINAQPYQREPLIIIDGRYGGDSGYRIDGQRYGGNGAGYYVSPSSRYYDNGRNYYGNSQRQTEYYDGRRGSTDYNRGYYDNSRGMYDNNRNSYDYGRGSYDYNRQTNGSNRYATPSNPRNNNVNYGTVNGNNASNYSSGRRGSSVFSQPQRDTRSNAEQQRQETYNQGSTRVVNGTTIVGGRR